MAGAPTAAPRLINPHAKEDIMSTAEITRIDSWSRELEARIRAALRDIRFGTITLVIQDGRVIQIDKNEKIRLK